MDQESPCDEIWGRSSGNEAEGHRARREAGLWGWGRRVNMDRFQIQAQALVVLRGTWCGLGEQVDGEEYELSFGHLVLKNWWKFQAHVHY